MSKTIDCENFEGKVILEGKLVFDGSLPPSCTFHHAHPGDKIAYADKGRPPATDDESRTIAGGPPDKVLYDYDYVPKSALSTLPDYDDSPNQLIINRLWDGPRKKEMPLGDFDTITAIIDNDYVQLSTYKKARVDYCGEGRNNTGPFSIGDEVMVVFEYQDVNRPVVVGFKDDPVGCSWYITVTRDDDEIMTEGVIFTGKNSDETELNLTYEYDEDREQWIVSLSDDNPQTSKGIYLFVTAEDSTITQYPYRYKPSTWHNSVDLIKPGEYEAQVPYVHSVLSHSLPNQMAYTYCEPTAWDWAVWGQVFGGTSDKLYFNNTFSRIRSVESSVPYKIKYSYVVTGGGAYCADRTYCHTEPDGCQQTIGSLLFETDSGFSLPMELSPSNSSQTQQFVISNFNASNMGSSRDYYLKFTNTSPESFVMQCEDYEWIDGHVVWTWYDWNSPYGCTRIKFFPLFTMEVIFE